jgi:hypothetical protein
MRFSLRIALVLMTICCVIWGAIYFRSRYSVAKLFGGRTGLSIVSHATRIEAFRLGDPPPEKVKQEFGASPFDYPVVAGPVAVPAKLADETITALRSPSSYGFDYAKACGWPIYGARLSFERDSDRVDVYLCFKCNVLTVCRDERIVGGEDFDDIRPVLVRTVKACFPQDGVIQALDER